VDRLTGPDLNPVIPPAYRRHAIGIIALALMATGGILYFTPDKSVVMTDLAAACLRIGPLLAALWLAYDHLKRVPVWVWCTLPVFVLLTATRLRWMLWLLVPLIAALAILKPRARPRRDR
jgi:hypothetical protein